MSEYGVTPTGFVPKRLDTIIDEIHGDLSEKWGVNTRQNPQSFFRAEHRQRFPVPPLIPQRLL